MFSLIHNQLSPPPSCPCLAETRGGGKHISPVLAVDLVDWIRSRRGPGGTPPAPGLTPTTPGTKGPHQDGGVGSGWLSWDSGEQSTGMGGEFNTVNTFKPLLEHRIPQIIHQDVPPYTHTAHNAYVYMERTGTEEFRLLKKSCEFISHSSK